MVPFYIECGLLVLGAIFMFLSYWLRRISEERDIKLGYISDFWIWSLVSAMLATICCIGAIGLGASVLMYGLGGAL